MTHKVGKSRKSQGHYDKIRKQENKMVRTLDKLAEFQMFDDNILPKLRKMVLENWSPEKIRKAFAPVMQARMIQAGLGNINAANTLKAIKDTLDRHEGTAVQRMNTVNTYSTMSRQELAALALQKLRDANIIDTTGRVVKDVDDEEEDK